MMDESLERAIAGVPANAWAVGVSGGADSVALLALLRQRADLTLHVVHLNHQARGAASTADAQFVQALSQHWGLPCTIARRDQIEPALDHAPTNPSARYRALRLALFRKVVQSHGLQGVILAHHADDQAETVMQRLIRSSGYQALSGMQIRTTVGGVVLLRPLLEVPRRRLRELLVERQIGWREDASNLSSSYLRNRLRRLLSDHSQIAPALVDLSRACAGLRDWSRSAAPSLPDRFFAAQLARLPTILSHESARRWLLERGVPADQIDRTVVQRLLAMANDAASRRVAEFPGKVRVRRRAGEIFVDQA